jgi:Uri superfamily endonuclease
MKGTYCLIIEVTEDTTIEVGKVGELEFKEGFYIYVGSALNSLESRIKRHLSSKKKVYWHVDYLLTRPESYLREVFFSIGEEKVECPIASLISKESSEIARFGCSDCKCSSHLFYFKEYFEAVKCIEKAFNDLNLKINDLKYLLSLE